MKITILCSDDCHPINPYLQSWMQEQRGRHDVELVRLKSQLQEGDILFLVSCREIIGVSHRSKYKASLVLHASDLPSGRGWSPHIWELINGAEEITLSMISAEDEIDSGKIWVKTKISIPQCAVWNEINHLLFSAEIELMNFVVNNFAQIEPVEQCKLTKATYFPRRTPECSRLDVRKSIAEQFNLLRVCDPKRFPAYFEYLGSRYLLKIERHDGE